MLEVTTGAATAAENSDESYIKGDVYPFWGWLSSHHDFVIIILVIAIASIVKVVTVAIIINHQEGVGVVAHWVIISYGTVIHVQWLICPSILKVRIG